MLIRPLPDLRSPAATAALPSVALLEITRGRARYRLRPVQSSVFLLGASPECHLVLADSEMPEFYAYLLLMPQRITVRHLGSGPELRVQGRAITTAVLVDGSLLELGAYAMKLRLPKATRPGRGRIPHWHVGRSGSPPGTRPLEFPRGPHLLS